MLRRGCGGRRSVYSRSVTALVPDEDRPVRGLTALLGLALVSIGAGMYDVRVGLIVCGWLLLTAVSRAYYPASGGSGRVGPTKDA